MLWLILACTDNLLVQKGMDPEGSTLSECMDNIDNDEDGYTDCDDQDCLIYTECTADDTDIVDTDEPDDTDDTDSQDTGDTQVDPNDQDGDGFTPEEGDCDDLDENVNPNSNDNTIDGKDQNCDDIDGPDLDGDGYVDINAGGDDCNDLDSSIYPGASEIDNDDVDQDCDGSDISTQAVYDDHGEYSFVVPAGISTITAGLWGAGGSGGEQLDALGGGGGYVEVIFSVTAGETLSLFVGEGGQTSGAGGGATAIQRGSDLLVIAGAGGGGASDGNSGNSWVGGAGGAGGQAGEDGQDLLYHQTGNGGTYCTSATGGTGATQSSGGIGGTSTGTAIDPNGDSKLCSGTDGSSLQGGASSGIVTQCNTTGPNFWAEDGGGGNGHSGAGGSGYYGGGGGGAIYTYCGAGGGGGSSWASSSMSSVVYLDGTGQIQGNQAEADGAGKGGDRDYGGADDDGTDGKIVFYW